MELSVFVYFIIASTYTCSLFDMPKINGKLRERDRESEFILHVEHTFLPAYQKLYFHFGIFKSYYYKIVLLLCLFLRPCITWLLDGSMICMFVNVNVYKWHVISIFCCWMSVPLMVKHTHTCFLWKQWRTIYGLSNNIIISSWVLFFFLSRLSVFTLFALLLHQCNKNIYVHIYRKFKNRKRNKKKHNWQELMHVLLLLLLCRTIGRFHYFDFQHFDFYKKENNCWIISYLPGSYNLINCTFSTQ